LNATSKMGGMGMACSLRKPATWHAVVAVFLQFFSWGVITAPMIKILNSEFGHNALLLNGIIMGVKGFLSFLSAPLIGALSDVYGRKLFLLITAFFTCVPIPFIKIHAIAYFVLMAVSGIFCIIFSVAFAYVADVTDESSRSLGYGLVTAGFAASLIISPALGAGIELLTGSDESVVILATLVALLDVFFIVIFVPESLLSEQKMAIKSLTFKQMNPFASLRGIWSDRKVLLMSMVAVLSYLPEAGQSTCFFVYLTLVLGFSPMMVGIFICYVGVLSTIFQTVILSKLIRHLGAKKTILVGLSAQLVELVWYGVSTAEWGVWAAGLFIAISSITYAAISAYLSLDTAKDKQGAVQGTLMGARGLCNGLGPAAFGLLFHFFGINILADEVPGAESLNATLSNNATVVKQLSSNLIRLGLNSTIIEEEGEEEMTTLAVIVKTLPGIPFLLMATCVLGAIVAALFLENITKGMDQQATGDQSEAKAEEEAGNVSSSQSENSETKMEIKSSSSSSNSSLAEVMDGKIELTELRVGLDRVEEEGGKIHINGQTIKASYAA